MLGKRMLALLLAIMLTVTVLPAGVFAAEETNGVCGDNLTWSLDDNVLTIVGTGPMYDYNGMNDSPWAYYAQTITEVVIGEGVTAVGNYAFSNCSSLLRAELPDTLKSIGMYGFHYCNQLTDIALPEGLETIGAMAFMNCDGLKSIVIPASVVSVGNSAFGACRFLKTVTIKSPEIQWGQSIFEGSIRLEQVIFAAGSTQITPWMFSSCEKLESIQLPENLVEIGNNAFLGCKSLKSITIPSSVTSIGKKTFRGCTALKEIRFLGNAPTIGSDAFMETSPVVYYPRGNTTWTRDIMGNYEGSITWSDGVNAFFSAYGSANWTLENGVLTIDDYLMALPNYEKDQTGETGRIPWYPFAQSVTMVVIGPGITGVGRNTFYGCDNLHAIRFMGNAPDLAETFLEGVTATVYYPADDDTWTEEIMQQYGGTITWKPYDAAESDDGAVRVFGATRYDTAFEAADMLKELQGVEKFQTIVVACGTDFADALSGSYLANQKNAPILLVRNRNQEIDQVKDYIRENLAPGGTVYLLGGTNAIPATMETGLEGFTVKRLAGATRYETNLEILKEAGVGDKDILVCTGKNFADGLSASAVNMPILLVKDSLSSSQKEFLNSLGGDNKIYIIGGTNAVNKSIANTLATYGATERIEGATRYETSVNIAKKFFTDTDCVVLAYGNNFPDGLSGGPLAYMLEAPLILTADGKDSAAVAYANGAAIDSGVVLGGTGLISDKVVRKICQLDANAEIPVV